MKNSPMVYSEVLVAFVALGLLFFPACSAGAPVPMDDGDSVAGGVGSNNVGACTDGNCLTVPDQCDGGKAQIVIKSVRPGETSRVLESRSSQSVTSRHLLGEPEESDDACNQSLDWTIGAEEEPVWEPPKEETFDCPEGSVRINVRDMWSEKAEPTLSRMPERPLSVVLIDEGWSEHAARQVNAGCDWYTTCLPREEIKTFQLNAIGGSGCSETGQASGKLDFSGLADSTEIWVYHDGAALSADYTQYPSAGGGFTLTDDRDLVAPLLCPAAPPDQSVPEGMIKLHIRYPWSDPDETGFAGTACGDEALGYSAPPYPTSLKLKYDGCNNAVAMLEFQNGHCPWYYALIPEESWTGKISVRYPSTETLLYTPDLPLPARNGSVNEYWLAYSGAPDDEASLGTTCQNWSYRANVYHFYEGNPGPGYAGCGGDGDVVLDPCNPPVPEGFSTVHFRYMWAGQKTFTYFPKPDFMPPWIVMEVNGGGGDKDIICFREEDRPWFNCPVPNSEFFEGASWRATDKTRDTDWNTVAPREFPSTPGEYWVRWTYGKPDIAETSKFEFYDYYPDGSHGDWSATGAWADDGCAPKPPAVPVVVGYGGWFPYDETDYAYPFGASLARTFPKSGEVQDLLDAFVQERYEIWKENYVRDDACGEGTARVKTDPPETVSEGQGYGIAISAAIGDKPTFVKLWNFVRHYLSQSSKKYCGGLMGWQWKGPDECRPRDIPCDPDSEGCGGGNDSAFDGDVDIGIGLVYAARQWPEYTQAALNWILKMECEVDSTQPGNWNYPAPGDTWNKNCQNYPGHACEFLPNNDGTVNLSYYPPGYFRVFGDFLQQQLSSKDYSAEERRGHRDFWYRTAETVYEMYERCYDNPAVDPGLVTDWGTYSSPCDSQSDNYNWSRALWRVSVDAAWFGNRTDLPETMPDSSEHFAPRSRMQAKIDNIQNYYSNFFQDNPPEGSANRFSTLCNQINPSGDAAGCDPAFDHNSYFVNTAISAYVPVFDNGGETTPSIRREALEEAVTATVFNDRYYQESIGVYTMLFLSGNFPNPLEVP